jgi:DNA-binding transcriptional MerR regulator
MADLPPKLFFRIGEVAGLVGVEPHVLRYWEREFRSIRPTKSAKGQRVYSRRDVENLLRVRDLLYRDGFTIAGAKKKMQRGGAEPAEPSDEPAEASAPRVEHDVDARSSDDAAEAPRERPLVEPTVREKLTAIRAEIEQFLDELGGS